jgi:hypothetical protein
MQKILAVRGKPGTMNRRTLLGRMAAAGSVLAVAGCLRQDTEEDALRIQDTAIEEMEDGFLSYVITISNVADREASGTLYVNSDLNGDATTKVRQVTIDAHTTEAVRITYDVQYSEVSNFSPSSDLVEE